MNLNQIRRIGKKYQLELIYLFGSRALEKNSKLSDVDIAVLLKKEKPDGLRELILNLIFDFSHIFSPYKVDLLILNEAPLALQNNVILEGKCLYYSDKEIKFNYEERIIKLYLDFKRYESEYYEEMHKTILKEAK